MENMKVRANENVLVSNVDDKAVLLNLETEAYFSLNGVGTDMWDQLSKHDTVAATFQALLDMYNVDEDRLRADLLELITQLQKAGLVTVEGNA